MIVSMFFAEIALYQKNLHLHLPMMHLILLNLVPSKTEQVHRSIGSGLPTNSNLLVPYRSLLLEALQLCGLIKRAHSR